MAAVVEERTVAYGELLPSIVYGESRLAAGSTGLLLELVKGPDLQGWLARKVLGDGHEQRSALDLLHVSNGAGFVGLELAHNLEGARDDAHGTILAAQEDIVGAGRNAGDFGLLQRGQGGEHEGGERVGYIEQRGVRELDLGDVEELERFPLQQSQSGRAVELAAMRTPAKAMASVHSPGASART